MNYRFPVLLVLLALVLVLVPALAARLLPTPDRYHDWSSLPETADAFAYRD